MFEIYMRTTINILLLGETVNFADLSISHLVKTTNVLFTYISQRGITTMWHQALLMTKQKFHNSLNNIFKNLFENIFKTL